MPLPSPLEPMLPWAGAALPERPSDWSFEVKHDGFRGLVYCEAEGVRVQSRSTRCMTAVYPELQELGRLLGHRSVLLDGELVAYDAQGQPCFESMQRRVFQQGKVPICFQVFDVLYLDGQPVMHRPYRERRALLEELSLQDRHWSTPSHHVGEGAAALLAASREAGMEGLVAKRLDSPYLPGKRSPDWQKFKNWCRQEFVVGGWRPDPEGGGGWLGSLLLGYYEEGVFRYAGGMELGFRDEHLAVLRPLLTELACAECPFVGRTSSRRNVRHVEPLLMVEAQFLGWTSNGALRHPSFKGFVLDRDPRGVIRESVSDCGR